MDEAPRTPDSLASGEQLRPVRRNLKWLSRLKLAKCLAASEQMGL